MLFLTPSVSCKLSILGAIIVIFGLYLLLWGKECDEEIHIESEEQSDQTCKDKKDEKVHKSITAQKDVLLDEP